jgi:hypothetical protein
MKQVAMPNKLIPPGSFASGRPRFAPRGLFLPGRLAIASRFEKSPPEQ